MWGRALSHVAAQQNRTVFDADGDGWAKTAGVIFPAICHPPVGKHSPGRVIIAEGWSKGTRRFAVTVGARLMSINYYELTHYA